MAGSSDDLGLRRRRHADMEDELEEGEIVVAGRWNRAATSETETEEYYNHYSSSESDDDEANSNARRYFSVARNDGEGSRSPSVHDGRAGSPSAVAAAPVLPCPVCGKEFTSRKAVCGHMKVHALERQEGEEKGSGKEEVVKRVLAVVRSWGGTGKRGGGGGSASGGSSRAVSPNSEPDTTSVVNVAAAAPQLVLEAVPLAYAAANNLPSPVRVVAPAETEISSGEGSSRSAQPTHDDAMAIVVAGGAAVVDHQAPPPPPSSPSGDQSAPAHQQQRPAAAGTQNPAGYTCAVCRMWFSTHQALGGHVAAHKNKALAIAAAAADAGEGTSHQGKPEKRHVCKVCAKEFATGVQLGGHMRKHYTGPPFPPKKKMRLDQPHPPPPPPPPAGPVVLRLGPPPDVVDLTLRLGLPAFAADARPPAPGAAVERVQPAAPAPAQETVEAVRPDPEPTTTGPVFLFGVDIGPRKRKAEDH